MSDDDLDVTTTAAGTKLMGSSSAWLVLIGLLCGYFALLLALGGHREWGELGVPPVSPGFFDLRSVTSGWDCARDHVGAWPDNPCDPWERPENYPRIWMAASILGLGEDDTYVIGSLIVVAFFATAILVLPGRASLGDALVYGLALCSPAVMFGVERGNVDIALFSMVAAGGLVMRRAPWGPPVASMLILVAAVLKLFPIAAIGMLAGLPRRTAVLCVTTVGGLFAVYAAATFRDIQTIERILPQGVEYSYGLDIFGGWLGRLVVPGRMWDARARRSHARCRDCAPPEAARPSRYRCIAGARPLLGRRGSLRRHLRARAQLRLPARIPPPDDSSASPLGAGRPSATDRDTLRHLRHSLAPEFLEQRAGSGLDSAQLERLDLRRRQLTADRSARSGSCLRRPHLPARRHIPPYHRAAAVGAARSRCQRLMPDPRSPVGVTPEGVETGLAPSPAFASDS